MKVLFLLYVVLQAIFDPNVSWYDLGFLTSPELFFVRNHGAVPVIEQDDILNWELSIEG